MSSPNLVKRCDKNVEFRRKKKRGINQKTRRLWFSAEGYRIVWRKKAFGINVKPGFQACVRTIVPSSENDIVMMWDFVEHGKRLYRTMKAAVDACEQHYKLWNQATECTGIRAIQELFGRQPSSVPKWVAAKLDRRVSVMLLDSTPGNRSSLYGKLDDDKPAEKSTKKPARKQIKKRKSKKRAKK